MKNNRSPGLEKQILAVIKDPGKPPRVEPLFENTLETLQEAVGGKIETVTICTNLVLICNREGVLTGLPFNVEVFGVQFYGPVIAVGAKDDEFVSLKASAVPMVLSALREKEE